MEDLQIIELYFSRDEQAITETDRKYGKLCRSIIYNILICPEDTEECVNDTYLGTWNCIPPARPSNFSAFLCRIARNLALKRLEYGPRCKLAQMLAFVEMQSSAENGVISFPIVIDSPNSLEQDKKNLESIIRTLMTWRKTNNQIIVASIEGKEIATEIEGTRIIKLTNPKNQLLSSEVYCELEDEINDMFVRF